MLVNIIEHFQESGRWWRIGENPDVPTEVADRWISEGKAARDNDGIRADASFPVENQFIVVVDAADSHNATAALSANQGRALREAHDALVGVVAGLGSGGGGGTSYAEVLNFSALPASPEDGTTCIVLQPQGVWLINRKPAGLYRFASGAWVYLGEVPDVYFVDNVLRFFDNADASKQLAFELSGITSGNVRTLTVPDKSGTIATLADLSGGAMTGADITAALNAYLGSSDWQGGGAWGGITGTLSAQTDLQSALDAKVPSSRTVAGKALTADVSLVKADVELGNVDNTSDANKPVSTATLTALNAKQATLVSATNIKTINGASILGSGDMSVALNTTVTLEHLPSTTAWAATITPASYVSRFGFSSNVAITVTVAGVTSPAANIQIQYSNDAGVSISSGPTTIGTIAANGSQTINIAPTTMPGGQFKVLITSGTGTGGTVGINVTMS